MSRVGFFTFRYLFGSAADNHTSAAAAPFGTDVDDIVGGFYNVHVVLNNNNGVARIHKALKHVNELVNVGGVETYGGFVENIDRLARGAFAKLA